MYVSAKIFYYAYIRESKNNTVVFIKNTSTSKTNTHKPTYVSKSQQINKTKKNSQLTKRKTLNNKYVCSAYEKLADSQQKKKLHPSKTDHHITSYIIHCLNKSLKHNKL